MTDKKNSDKQLTEMQQKALDFLFGEAEGDHKKALELAGYSSNSRVSEVFRPLRDHVIEMAKDILMLNAPKASLGLVSVLQSPAQAGASIKVKTADSILNRVGLAAKDSTEGVELKVPKGGLFILPAKDRDSQEIPSDKPTEAGLSDKLTETRTESDLEPKNE